MYLIVGLHSKFLLHRLRIDADSGGLVGFSIWFQCQCDLIAGARWVLGLGTLICSVFTMLTPFAVHSYPLLIAFRILVGLGEGVTVPGALALISGIQCVFIVVYCSKCI